MKAAMVKRMLPVGAEVLPEGGVHFRVWASRAKRVAIGVETVSLTMRSSSPPITAT